MAYKLNPGRIPRECEIRSEDGGITGFRNVHVILFNKHDTKARGQSPWPAAGRQPLTNWRISAPAHPFEIERYEVLT